MVARMLYCLTIFYSLALFSSVYADDSYPVFPYHKFTYTGEELEISTEFNNGGLYKVEETETNVFDIWPYSEDESRWGWVYLKSFTRSDRYDHTGFTFHFRITGCKNKKVVFNFHVKEEVDSDTEDITAVYANPDFPVISYDGETWMRMDTKSMKSHPTEEYWKIVTVEHEFTEDTAYLSFQYPYSSTRLDKFIERIHDSPYCTIGNAGRSTEGKDIKLISITNPDVALKEKKVVWFTGLQHCSELGAGRGLEAIIDFLLSDDPAAHEARHCYFFNFIPLVNVDAVDEGRGRTHSLGVNLNREWENDNPVEEISSITETLDNWIAQGNSIDLLLDIHGFSSKDGEWTLLMPEEAYSVQEADDYKKFVEIFQHYIPKAKPGLKSIPGWIPNPGLRKYGAIAMSIDGYIYDWTITKYTNLSSYYSSGNKIWSLEECRACGKTYVEILLMYEDWLRAAIDKSDIPVPYNLLPAYPNPFNTETTISFEISEPELVTLTIYNITGQIVKTLMNKYYKTGHYTLGWNGRDNKGAILESGIYIIRMKAGDFSSTRKILHLK